MSRLEVVIQVDSLQIEIDGQLVKSFDYFPRDHDDHECQEFVSQFVDVAEKTFSEFEAEIGVGVPLSDEQEEEYISRFDRAANVAGLF